MYATCHGDLKSEANYGPVSQAGIRTKEKTQTGKNNIIAILYFMMFYAYVFFLPPNEIRFMV